MIKKGELLLVFIRLNGVKFCVKGTAMKDYKTGCSGLDVKGVIVENQKPVRCRVSNLDHVYFAS